MEAVKGFELDIEKVKTKFEIMERGIAEEVERAEGLDKAIKEVCTPPLLLQDLTRAVGLTIFPSHCASNRSKSLAVRVQYDPRRRPRLTRPSRLHLTHRRPSSLRTKNSSRRS